MGQSTVCLRFRSSGFNPWALLDLKLDWDTIQLYWATKDTKPQVPPIELRILYVLHEDSIILAGEKWVKHNSLYLLKLIVYMLNVKTEWWKQISLCDIISIVLILKLEQHYCKPSCSVYFIYLFLIFCCRTQAYSHLQPAYVAEVFFSPTGSPHCTVSQEQS